MRRLLDRAEEEARQVLANPEAQSLDASLRDGGQVLSTYDNHPADLGDTTFAREKGLGLRGSAHERLARIAEARERLAQGRYGRCTRCGAAIPEGRLKAMPWTATCAPCAEAEGARRARRRALGASPWPVRPPFGQGPEEGQQPVEGDGEDIWHEVARYGTSSRGPVPPEPPEDGVPEPERRIDPHSSLPEVALEEHRPAPPRPRTP